MRRADFSYPLPQELIARHPLPERGGSRLLALDGGSGALRDLRFVDLPSLLAPGDLLVINDTRVIPARVRGRKSSGGACEILLERALGPRRLLVQARASKGLKTGGTIGLPGEACATVTGRRGEFYELELDRDALPYLESHGSMPLPPYLGRDAEPADRERYQTVYATEPGAVAAPTAGLHFDEAMLARLRASGVAVAPLTLHVGAGTFQPLRVEELEAHRLHAERFRLPAETAAAVSAARVRGGRVVAVGTTVVRALEAAAAGGALAPGEGETDLFIRPGFRFRVVDALVTNFHLPESSLLMLVAAFAGRERVLAAYHHAVGQRYRFYSYGDAMIVTPDPAALAPRREGP
ncbi:MAG TPA: tRNA preQ1(34) S-adenosylmethionine ribosyltransferase-isomerase QueA [Steroidobacteraceae bacterium]|nr:tRNA preQ1(34) S-adenosylmethionine ribosyltransferase-isomerase QueA [Steroidobacteraceae bacterium]